MDGSSAAFLLRPDPFSTMAEPASGILYIEDFDAAPNAGPNEPGGVATEVRDREPVFTLADVEAAREEGRLAGLNAALEDAHLLQAEIQTACIQGLGDAVSATQAALIKTVRDAGNDGARMLLGVLQAAVPALMERHAAGEIEAVLRGLLPGLSLETDMRVRAHPAAVEMLRDLVADMLPHGLATLSVTADPTLAPGDVQLAWRHGGAARDTGQIWAAIRDALATLSLPTMQELCLDCGS